MINCFKWQSDDSADDGGTLPSFLEHLLNFGDGEPTVPAEVEFYRIFKAAVDEVTLIPTTYQSSHPINFLRPFQYLLIFPKGIQINGSGCSCSFNFLSFESCFSIDHRGRAPGVVGFDQPFS